MRAPLVAALVLFASSASAQTRGLTLAWEAPAGCPSRDAVLAMVARARGAESDAHDRTLSVDAGIRREGQRWRAEIRTRGSDAEGERRLEARTCARLAQGVALVVALAMDAEDPSEVSSSAAATPSTQSVIFVEDNEIPPALRPRPRRPPRPPPARVRLGLSAQALLDGTYLPEVAPGARIGVHLRTTGWEFRLELGQLASRASELRPGASVEVGAVMADGIVCSVRSPRVALCVGVEAALVTARSAGFVQNANARQVAVGVPLRLEGRWPITQALSLTLTPEAVIMITPPRYVVAGWDVVHEVPAVVVRFGLGVTWTMP